MKSTTLDAVRFIVLAPLSVAFAIPLYVVLISAFKTNREIVSNPLGINIDRLTTDNFVAALRNPDIDVWQAYWLTAIITLGSTLGLILLSSMLAYRVARSRRTWASMATLLLLLGMIVPPQLTLLPAVKVLASIGLLFTPQGLILYDIAVNMPLATLLYIRFIRAIPYELEEAAAIDGANPLRVLWHIVIPLLRPGTSSIGVLLMIAIWNDFIHPQIMLGTAGVYTITTGIFRAIGRYGTDWGLLFAFVVLAAIPLVIVYVSMQRHIIAGIVEGGVK